MLWGVATGLVLQAPLGWWALRSIGTEQFMVSVGLGMLVRLAVVGGGGPRGAARARAARRADAGGDGRGPGGAASGRGRHGGCGNIRGKASDDAIRSIGWRWWRLLLGRGRARGARRSTAAQEHAAREQGHRPASTRPPNQIDIIHHIGNSHELEIPLSASWQLPQVIPPIHIGGLAIDLSPTKHLVFMLLAAALVALVFVLSARAIARAQAAGRPAKGFAGAMEATALYVRQEVILPNVGHHGEGFVPYLLTLFFFILAMNLLGLLPWGATATGNIAVTAALAIMAFLVIEVTGMRTLGPEGLYGTIFYLPHGLPGGIGGSILKVCCSPS